MKKNYDFSKAKRNPYAKRLKRQLTIRLDTDTIKYFQGLSREFAVPYQTLMNMYLRECASARRRPQWESNGVLPDPRVLDAVENHLGLCFVRWTWNIGHRLKAWRKPRGLDQPKAARRIGVCLQTVAKLERRRLHTAALEVRGRVFDAVTGLAAGGRAR